MSKETKKHEDCDYKNNNKDDVESGAALGHPKYGIGEENEKSKK